MALRLTHARPSAARRPAARVALAPRALTPRALALLALAFLAMALLALGASPALGQDTTTARRQPTTLPSIVRPDSARKAGTDSAARARRARAAAGRRAATKAATKAATPKPEPVWPVKGPDLLPGSVLPAKRIVAYYGNPLSKRMGILGELPPEQMLAKLDSEVVKWQAADTATPVQPALHLVAIVAQAGAGSDGKYRMRMDSALIEKVYGWAQSRNAILFLDLQVGKSTLKDELPHFVTWLQRPDVHLGLDPEFSMKGAHPPGKRVGTYDAKDINYAIEFLGDLVTKHALPPKVLVIHRFTRPMLTNSDKIRLDPRVQTVIHMDGWGPPWMKIASYERYVYEEPVQFTGFKLFYKNDTKRGHPLMQPADILKLTPVPLYIQYQ